MQTESEDLESEVKKMPMPEFIAGYLCGYGSVVIAVILTGLLFVRKKDGNTEDSEKSQ